METRLDVAPYSDATAICRPKAADGSDDRNDTTPGAAGAAAKAIGEPMVEFRNRNRFSRDDLIACGQGRMFGPGNAQLPLPPMLMFDRIAQIADSGGAYNKGEIVAELDVSPDLWFFACHFEGDPVMPGCLGLDALWQLVGFHLAWLGNQGRGRALGVGDVKFSGQVQPTVKHVSYHIDIRRVISRKLVLGIADGVVKADGEPIYEAHNLRVGLFTEE